MPAKNKVGTQLLVTPEQLDQGRALAIVRGTSVADVWRELIDLALPTMELRHVVALDELDVELAKVGGDRSKALARMLADRRQETVQRFVTPGLTGSDDTAQRSA